MGKWTGAVVGLIVVSTVLLTALRMRKRRRGDFTIDQEELNSWFRRHK